MNIAEFDGTYTTSYQSAIVTKALSCVLFELFNIEQYHYLETRSGVIQRYWHEFLLSFNCNYGPLLYHFRDKARLAENHDSFIPHPHNARSFGELISFDSAIAQSEV